MRENKVETAVWEYAEATGFLQRKFVSPGHKHVPDRLFSLPVVGVFFIEFKAPGKDLESGQEREARRFRRAGARVYKVDDIKEGKGLLDTIRRTRELP